MITDTNTKGNFLKVSLATMIVKYQHVALQSLSKEIGISSAKGLDGTSRTHSLAP
jgi:hypothetical protein